MDATEFSPSEIDSVIAALGYREREEVAAEFGPAIAAEPSQQAIDTAARVSDKAFTLIVDYETGGRAFYDKVIRSRPIWPKAASGVTIGFGYDLGYVSRDEYRRDWASVIATLTPAQQGAMEACVGAHGGKDSDATMQRLLQTVKDIVFGWDQSKIVFKAKTLPKFALLTQQSLPNCALLNGDCFGVLVSLTFNRGASYSIPQKPGDTRDRYREMRAIKGDMTAKDFADIPRQLTSMVRIWEGTAVETGLRRRRLDEAKLFTAGLAAAAPASI